MKQLILTLIFCLPLAAQAPTVINSSDLVSASRATINTNFSNLYTERMTYMGTYAGGTTYGKNDVVASSGIWYVSLQAANTGNTPVSSSSWWVAIPGSGGGGSSAMVVDFKAAICQSGAASLALNTPTVTPPIPDCAIGSNGVIYGVAKFADTITESVQGSFGLPASLTSASAEIRWRTSIANTGLFAFWQLQTACLADNESDDPAWNTAQTVQTAAKSAANRQITSTIATVTLTGCAAGERLYWNLYRDPAHASDTLGATAELMSVKWTVQ